MIKHIIANIINDTYFTKITFAENVENYIHINKNIIVFNEVVYCYKQSIEVGGDSVALQSENYDFQFDNNKNLSAVDFYQDGEWISMNKH